MMALLLKWGASVKNFLICAGLLIAGVFVAIFVGEKKQQAKDTAKAATEVDKTLTKIAAESKGVQNSVQNNPATGPDSSASQLQDDWSE